MLDLREDLAVLGATVRSGLDPDAAARWGEAPEVPFPAGARYIAPVFGAAVVISFALYMAGVLTRTPFLVVLLLRNGLRILSGRSNLARRCSGRIRRRTIWCCWRTSCSAWKTNNFRAPLLQQLHARLKAGTDQTASAEIARLGRLGERLDWQENKMFAPIAVRAAVDRASGHGDRTMAARLRAVTFANGSIPLENSKRSARWQATATSIPRDVFPELADVPGGCFEAEALAHPLMPESHASATTCSLGGETRLLDRQRL